jgi:PiT family inorganic phosphate transporter
MQWLSSAATSLARGMNDAPKIVALGLAASMLGAGRGPSPATLFLAAAAGMTAGGLAAGRRVTHVLAEKVAEMDVPGGLAASAVTAVLVTAGAVHGLPMSTTHVASGGIAGAGALRGSLNGRTLRRLALAWVVTLPASAALGAAGYALARGLGL